MSSKSEIDPELADLQVQTTNTMFLFEKLKKVKEKINSKTTELEKAKGELSLSDKEDKYKRYLLEQKSRIFNSCDKKVETLEDRLDNKLERIEQEIQRLQDKKEDYLRKINLVEDAILRLQHKEKDVQRKIQHQKSSFDEETQDKLRYYDDELKRLLDGVKSTPKIRSLEVDLVELWEQLNRVETELFNEPCSIKSWKRELPNALKEETQPTLESSQPSNPPPAKTKRLGKKVVLEPIEETVQEQEPPPVKEEKDQRTKVSEKKGLLIDDSSEEEKPKKEKQQASVFGKIIQSTKRVE